MGNAICNDQDYNSVHYGKYPQQQQKTFGFTIFAKRRSTQSPLYLPDLTTTPPPPVPTTNSSNSQQQQKQQQHYPDNNERSMVVSPKRASWIQFGIGNMETKHKFGVRETYTMTVRPNPLRRTGWFGWRALLGRRQKQQQRNAENPSKESLLLYLSRLKYTRYGEGPPFYAPGRMCMLELEAEPIDSLSEASVILQDLVKHHLQGWDQRKEICFKTHGVGSKGNEIRLQLRPDQTTNKNVLSRYMGNALMAWDKLQPLTKLVSLIRNERRLW